MEITEERTFREKPFYMVYVEGKCAPAKKYDSAIAACDNACQLAKKEQTNAYVLKAVAGYGYYYGIAGLKMEEEQ